MWHDDCPHHPQALLHRSPAAVLAPRKEDALHHVPLVGLGEHILWGPEQREVREGGKEYDKTAGRSGQAGLTIQPNMPHMMVMRMPKKPSR